MSKWSSNNGRATSLEIEADFQTHWKLRRDFNAPAIHDDLLRNEFALADNIQRWLAGRSQGLLEHCYEQVPHYREQFQRRGLGRSHFRDPSCWQRLPILSRGDLQSAGTGLHATNTPADQNPGGITRTSGSTGEPVIVRHSDRSLGLFLWLKQRELRWFRWRPEARMLSIRPAVELSPRDQGKSVGEGVVQALRHWPQLGRVFQTGPAWGFSNINSVAEQARLLDQLRPNYLLMQAAGLEHLSLQERRADAQPGLQGVLAISQTLTPSMRSHIENSLKVPVQQNYGLNEIGLVASRCPEAGRYHIHSEHCLVEIVDPQGQPCQPGETGKLLVTALNNWLMPLLRYDTDDTAMAVEGPCPCGRTLPSIGPIYGRYRRFAFLPEGTMQRWGAIQMHIYQYGQENPGSIRRYQAFQDESGDFHLRIDTSPEVLADLEQELRRQFMLAADTAPCPCLHLSCASRFEGMDARKFESFISAFTPEMDC